MRTAFLLVPLVMIAASVTCVAATTATAPAVADTPRPASVSDQQVNGMCSRVVDRLWNRVDHYWHGGDYPRAVGLDRIITEDDPHFLEPYSTGGWLMESLGHTADAEAYYRLGVTNNPDEAYLRHQLGFFYFNTLKDYPKAIVAFRGAILQKDVTIVSWKMLAHAYEKNKQLAEAVAIWQTLNQRHPNDGVIMHNLQRDQLELVAAPSSASSQAAPVQ